jgi:bacterioferritin-associated ferredoxin
MDYCDPSQECPERFVCHCLRITEHALAEVLTQLPIRNMKELRQLTGAGDGCTCCHERLKQMIHQHAYSSSPSICSVK